jgi:hypothetical protein
MSFLLKDSRCFPDKTALLGGFFLLGSVQQLIELEYRQSESEEAIACVKKEVEKINNRPNSPASC